MVAGAPSLRPSSVGVALLTYGRVQPMRIRAVPARVWLAA
jgi:hypothetical protein